MNAKHNREKLRQEIANGNLSPQGYRAKFIRYGKKKLLLKLDELAFEFNQAYGTYDIMTLQDQLDIIHTTTQSIQDEIDDQSSSK